MNSYWKASLRVFSNFERKIRESGVRQNKSERHPDKKAKDLGSKTTSKLQLWCESQARRNDCESARARNIRKTLRMREKYTATLLLIYRHPDKPNSASYVVAQIGVLPGDVYAKVICVKLRGGFVVLFSALCTMRVTGFKLNCIVLSKKKC